MGLFQQNQCLTLNLDTTKCGPFFVVRTKRKANQIKDEIIFERSSNKARATQDWLLPCFQKIKIKMNDPEHNSKNKAKNRDE